MKWFNKNKPDILCLQETRASAEQVPEEIMQIKDYKKYFVLGEKKGYSGVGVLTKIEPSNIEYLMGKYEFDREGRFIKMVFNEFILYNIYFPNGKQSEQRLKYKINFYAYILNIVKENIKNNEKIIITGDVNTAHREIDLARPKENENNSGFLPIERKWIDKLLDAGFIDTFRYFNKEANHYTWWDYKTKSRKKNIGWRIDYFFISKNAIKFLKNAYILNNVYGSDHCPIGIELTKI